LHQENAHISEHELLQLLIAGNPLAKKLLYERYAAPLYGIMLQIVGDPVKANDLIIKLFSYCFQNASAYSTSGYHNLFTWLFKKAREYAVESSLPITSNHNDTSLVKRSNSSFQVFADTLAADEQLVFRLSFFNGLSRAAIGRLLAKDEEEINLLLKQAMVAFRKFIH